MVDSTCCLKWRTAFARSSSDKSATSWSVATPAGGTLSKSCLASTAVSYVQVRIGASGRDLLGLGLESEAAALLGGAASSATRPAAVVTNRKARDLSVNFCCIVASIFEILLALDLSVIFCCVFASMPELSSVSLAIFSVTFCFSPLIFSGVASGCGCSASGFGCSASGCGCSTSGSKHTLRRRSQMPHAQPGQTGIASEGVQLATTGT